MKRRSVKVIKSRLEDIEVGDVVNRTPEAELGWFTVDAITTLFNGHLQLADVTEQLTVSGDHKDMVGLQLVEEVELDDRGFVAPAAPTIVTAPSAPTDDSQLLTSSPHSPDLSSPPGTEFGIPSDLSAEAATAAEVATGMDGPAGGGPHVPAGVNLALVAELLEDLDVGEDPATTEPSTPFDAPTAGAAANPAMPAGARPVYGTELPMTPSYKTPVVVPDGDLLPRRSRAA